MSLLERNNDTKISFQKSLGNHKLALNFTFLGFFPFIYELFLRVSTIFSRDTNFSNFHYNTTTLSYNLYCIFIPSVIGTCDSLMPPFVAIQAAFVR